ncbi:MAG: sugar transferase [Bacteroidales bacterium]|jgi:lipopolysaccharide/colanic/teichoic acid biosynthesis glycosyltransferase|nr:sugar transferase [Bacteroidales bacterium]
MKRIFDIVSSILTLLLLWPFMLMISIAIATESKGGIIYRQLRVGRYDCDFVLFKFRTMFVNSDKEELLTVGNRDARITRTGYYLRKYKLDELPQLFNIIRGDMSVVGPRPEVRKYVSLYSDEEKGVLVIRPGLTDYASLAYINENEILAAAADPEQAYIQKVMPEKLRLNLQYIKNQSFMEDMKLIFKTLGSIIKFLHYRCKTNMYPL